MNNNAKIVQCPKCKGSGQQINRTYVGITNIMFPVFWGFEKLLGTDNHLETCSRCDGEGFIVARAKQAIR